MPAVPRSRKATVTPSDEPTPNTTGTTESSDKSPPSPSSPPAPEKRTPADRKLESSIAGMYAGAGTVIQGIGVARALSTGDERTLKLGIDLQEQSERLASAWMTLADRNPKVKANLKKFIEAGAAAELVGLHTALLLPFLPGILPGVVVGTTVPAYGPNGSH